jgi:hypothetical protein
MHRRRCHSYRPHSTRVTVVALGHELPQLVEEGVHAGLGVARGPILEAAVSSRDNGGCVRSAHVATRCRSGHSDAQQNGREERTMGLADMREHGTTQ